ncbi:MAG: hypothetical protein IH944_01120 [Armatimonadetes bacterium]|nr:hypothetical protein [Armatimonadota bacterium]
MDVVAIIGVLIGFGLVVVLPIVAVLTAHQRKMAELIHKNSEPPESNEVLSRLDALQRQMNDMQDRQNELILEKHDQLPPPAPKVEDRIRE